MYNLSKKYNTIVKIEKLPTSILGIYVNVFDKPHILINEIVHKDTYEFMFYSCLYYKNEGVGKITVDDMSNIDNEAFVFARNKLNGTDCT